MSVFLKGRRLKLSTIHASISISLCTPCFATCKVVRQFVVIIVDRPLPSSKVHNLSCENEFYLHENEKSFPYRRLSTHPRFETEGRRNSEMAYCLKVWIKSRFANHFMQVFKVYCQSFKFYCQQLRSFTFKRRYIYL